MSTVIDLYEYAKLATAAYVTLDGEVPTDSDGIATVAIDSVLLRDLADDQGRLPEEVADFTFISSAYGSPWSIPAGGYHGNDSNGFAATFFEVKGARLDFPAEDRGRAGVNQAGRRNRWL